MTREELLADRADLIQEVAERDELIDLLRQENDALRRLAGVSGEVPE